MSTCWPTSIMKKVTTPVDVPRVLAVDDARHVGVAELLGRALGDVAVVADVEGEGRVR